MRRKVEKIRMLFLLINLRSSHAVNI